MTSLSDLFMVLVMPVVFALFYDLVGQFTDPVTAVHLVTFLCYFDQHTYLIILFIAFIFYSLLYPLFSNTHGVLVMSASCAQCLVVVRNHNNFELEQPTTFCLLFVWP